MPAERRRRRRPGGGWAEDGKRLEVAAVRGWARRCPRRGGSGGADHRRPPASTTGRRDVEWIEEATCNYDTYVLQRAR